MGANDCIDVSPNTDVAAAFDECRDQARYEHGHGGYTGSIAEKSSYVVFDLPDDVSVEMAIEGLRNGWRYEQQDEKQPAWLPERFIDAYESKWGPAVAIKIADRGWVFLGTASE